MNVTRPPSCFPLGIAAQPPLAVLQKEPDDDSKSSFITADGIIIRPYQEVLCRDTDDVAFAYDNFNNLHHDQQHEYTKFVSR